MEARFAEACDAIVRGRFAEGFAAYVELTGAGHVGATIGLAYLHLRGEGVRRDIAKGLELLEQAAANGMGNAAYNLGALHQTGDFGVPQDPQKSRQFFLLARQLGCTLPIVEPL